MTELLYQTDSYLIKFDARVTETNQEMHAILLDRTAFFPGGGGQPYDHGVITAGETKYTLKRARSTREGLWHIIAAEGSLPEVGTDVQGEVDWDRRFKVMRTHSAMHVLCGTIFRDYGALVTGGDMEPLRGRMDFEFETLHKDLVQVIEESVNAEIEKGHDVRVAILPREEAFAIPDLIRTKINLLPDFIKEVRTVEIVGLDLQADGGTHVHNTKEIGRIRVPDYKSKGKINKRIYVELEE
ncbi:MAG: alanyl-tRNA editing protein [Anaerolineaceae bacterium]|nr:alanyl-tRNA editing protein [Anaerolineaceae bacterium]